jgi:hypothetical protein
MVEILIDVFSSLYVACSPRLFVSLRWHTNCILSLRPWLSKPPTIGTTKAAAQQLAIVAGPVFSSPFLEEDL